MTNNISRNVINISLLGLGYKRLQLPSQILSLFLSHCEKPKCWETAGSGQHTKCKGPPAPTKHLFTGCPQSLQIIPAKDRRLGEREFSAPFLEYLIPVPITPLYRKHHGSFWMVTCLLLSHHSPIPGQMVSFLVSLFYRTFSFLLCSSLYCWSLPPAQSASCLIIVSKPAVAERIHFLLFGPWKMVTRAVELMLQEKNMKFFFILLFSASRSLRLP